jgi:hypothetical protein
MSWPAVAAAAILAFVASMAWYIAFAVQRAKLLGIAPDPGTARRPPPPMKVLVELARNAAFAIALSWLIGATGMTDLAGAVRLALLLWLAFPVLILAGSVMWENVPWRLALIHAGDWFVKLVLVAAVLAVWR